MKTLKNPIVGKYQITRTIGTINVKNNITSIDLDITGVEDGDWSVDETYICNFHKIAESDGFDGSMKESLVMFTDVNGVDGFVRISEDQIGDLLLDTDYIYLDRKNIVNDELHPCYINLSQLLEEKVSTEDVETAESSKTTNQ